MRPTIVQPADFASLPPIPFREPGRRPSEHSEPVRAAAAHPSKFPDAYQLLDDVQVMNLPDPEWIVAGLIPKDGRVTIYAPPNTGKTSFLAKLAVSIATGRDFFDHAVNQQGGVIYVPSEDVNGFKVRLEAVKQAARLPAAALAGCGVYTFTEGINLLDAVNVGLFIDFVKASGGSFAVVMIDTLSGAMPGANENAIESMGLAMAHAKQIMTALGVTVILSHHTNASGNRERGHTVVRGESDAMIALDPVDDVVKVENNKQRNGPWCPAFELRLTPLGKSVVLRLSRDIVPEAGHLSEPQRRVLTVLADLFSADGATKAEWMRASCATGMSESTFWRASKDVHERNYASTVGKSNYGISALGRKAIGA